MQDDAVTRAQWGDLSGLNLAGMVRMSDEAVRASDLARAAIPTMTGHDIKGRDVQELDCKAVAEKRGGQYVFTYEEPDTSAWKRRRVRQPDGTVVWRVIRPIFEGALEDLKRGVAPNGERIDGLIVYDLDRLTRDNRHLEDAIDVVTHHRRLILDTTGSVDLLTENGRSMARVMVAMSNKQSADTARRVARKHLAMQLAGIPTGGRRPFGWQDDKRTLDEAESAAIRQGAERILAGAPVSTVVIDWNERGISTVHGKRWAVDTVKLVYRNPRICGYRSRVGKAFNPETGTEHQWMETVTDADGRPVIGQWESILTVTEWEAIVALIGGKYTPARGRNSRKYLLTGTLRCGRDGCNAKLRAYKRKGDSGRFYYGCPGKAGGGCGGVSISGPETDELIEAAVIAKYEEEAALRPSEDRTATWDGEPRLAKVREDIRDLTSAWRDGSISGARYFALLPELEAEERSLAGDRAAWLARSQVAASRPKDLRAEWAGYLLPEKRAFIEEALAAVLVSPANGRPRRYQERLEPVWREE